MKADVVLEESAREQQEAIMMLKIAKDTKIDE